jgi:prepilin-type N-terminal cleavage/methylation domain-containing protein/prepilin-type processing-associated H-X9-DG protein
VCAHYQERSGCNMRELHHVSISALTDKRKRTHGFTLIELLVVVAIIALLISVLLPSLAAARNQAKVTACLANLHDLGVALHTYAFDNPSYFPPTPYVGSDPGDADSPYGDDNLFILWYKKYARNIASFSCPATKYRVRPPVVYRTRTNAYGIDYQIRTQPPLPGPVRNDFAVLAQKDPDGYGTSYEYNLWYYDSRKPNYRARITWYHAASPHGGAPYELPWELSGMVMKTQQMVIPNPAFSILMHDADDYGVLYRSGSPFSVPNERNNRPDPWDNHGVKALNVLFGDGHVASARSDREAAAIWARQGTH